MRTFLVAAALLLSIAAPEAQTVPPGPASPERDGGWFAFGVGSAQPDGVAGVISANFGRERIVQVGLHATTSGLFAPAVPTTNAVHLGYGFSGVDRYTRAAITAGPAVVWGVSDPDTERRYVTGGVLVNVQLMVTPLVEFGLGLDVFATINPEVPAIGAAITFALEGNK